MNDETLEKLLEAYELHDIVEMAGLEDIEVLKILVDIGLLDNLPLEVIPL